MGKGEGKEERCWKSLTVLSQGTTEHLPNQETVHTPSALIPVEGLNGVIVLR